MSSLYEVTNEYLEVLNALEESGADEQTFTDTLETFKDDLIKKGQNVAAYFQNLDAQAKAIKEAEQKMAKRRKTIENHSERLKTYLRESMVASEITEISCPQFSVKLGKPSKIVIIDDAEQLPSELVTVKTVKSPDKLAIKKALQSGEDVSGARLEDGKHRLTIK